MKRILQLTDSIEKRNGRMSVVMNIYRKIDRSKIQFDFLVTDYGYENYYDEITKLGGKVYFLPYDKLSLKKIKHEFLKIVNLRKYDYVHYHALSKWGECVSYAKQQNIKVIVHSHATVLSNSLFKSIRNRLFSLNILTTADERIAISPEAGKKLFLWQSFKYIPNMVEYNRFSFSQFKRSSVRQKYNIKNEDKVIGMVGRISEQKNQLFALKVLNQLIERKENVKLMIVGDTDKKELSYYKKVKKYINENDLNEKVIFTGLVNSVGDYYSAFDILWLPSLYEGMPTVGIEAQANGMPILVSDKVTKSMKIIDAVKFLSIKNSINLWIHFTIMLLKMNRERDALRKFKNSPFNEQSVLNEWMKLYK